MRILMLTHTYHPSVGGGIRYKTAIVDHFRERGHAVDVLAVSTDRNMHVESTGRGSIIRMPEMAVLNSAQVAPTYPFAFGKLAPSYDVLLFNFPSPMCEVGLVLHARKLRDARKVCMYHADIVDAKRFSGPYNRFVTRPFLQSMDAIVVSSPKIIDSSPHLAPFRDEITVIPFGIDPALFELETGLASEPRDDGDLRVLFVGRLSRYKGIDHLIRAMKDAPGHLRIVGTGPLQSGLEDLNHELGLTDRVEFLGRISDEQLVREYHEADVLVLPSTDAGEAFGYVLIEAMMCSAALISTEVGTGTSWVNVHGETGLVIPPADTNAIRVALVELDRDRARLEGMKRAARARALETFDIHRMFRETAEILRV